MRRPVTIGDFTFIPLPPPTFPSEGLRVEREYSAELGNFKDSLAHLREASPGRMSDEQTAELEAKVSLTLRESLKFDLSGMNLKSHSESVLGALERQNPISKMASGLSEFIETATTREVIDEEAKRLGLNDFLEGFKGKNPAHSNVPFAFYKYALRREFNLIRRQASQLERPRNRGILEGEDNTQQAQKFLNKELAKYQFALDEGSQYPKEICIKQTATLLAGGSLNIALSNPASRKFESRLGVALPSDRVLSADQLSALEAIESAIIKGDNNKGGKAEIRIGTGGGKSFLTDLIRDSYTDKNLTFTEEGKTESKRIGAITTIDLNSTDAEINAVFDLPTASSQVLAGSMRPKKAVTKVTGDLNGKIIQLDEAYFFGKFDRINNDSTTPEEVENKRNEAIAGLRRRGATVIILGASESPDKIKIEIRRIEEKIAQEENKIEQDSNRNKKENRDTVNIGSVALGKFKRLRYLTHNTEELNQTTHKLITTKVVVRRSYNDIRSSIKGLYYVEDAHAILNLAILGLENLPEEAKILKDLLDGIVKGSHPDEKKKKDIFESLTNLLEQTDLLSGFDDDRKNKDASVILSKLTTKLGVKKGQYHSLMDRREGETEEKKGKTREKFEDSVFLKDEREMDLGGEMSLLNLIRPDSEKPDESYLPKLEVKTKENEKGESGNSGEKLQYILPDFIINEETCSDEDLKEIARLSNADIVIVPHKDEEGKLRCRIFRNDEVTIADVGDVINESLGQIADKKVVSFFARTDDKWRGNATGGDYGFASLGITHQQIQARTSEGLNFNKLMQAYGRDRTSPLEAAKYPAQRRIILHEKITKEQFWEGLKTKTKIDDEAHAVGYLRAKQRQAAAGVFTEAIRGASSKYKEYEINKIYQQDIQSDQLKPKVDVATASSAFSLGGGLPGRGKSKDSVSPITKVVAKEPGRLFFTSGFVRRLISATASEKGSLNLFPAVSTKAATVGGSFETPRQKADDTEAEYFIDLTAEEADQIKSKSLKDAEEYMLRKLQSDPQFFTKRQPQNIGTIKLDELPGAARPLVMGSAVAEKLLARHLLYPIDKTLLSPRAPPTARGGNKVTLEDQLSKAGKNNPTQAGEFFSPRPYTLTESASATYLPSSAGGEKALLSSKSAQHLPSEDDREPNTGTVTIDSLSENLIYCLAEKVENDSGVSIDLGNGESISIDSEIRGDGKTWFSVSKYNGNIKEDINVEDFYLADDGKAVFEYLKNIKATEQRVKNSAALIAKASQSLKSAKKPEPKALAVTSAATVKAVTSPRPEEKLPGWISKILNGKKEDLPNAVFKEASEFADLANGKKSICAKFDFTDGSNSYIERVRDSEIHLREAESRGDKKPNPARIFVITPTGIVVRKYDEKGTNGLGEDISPAEGIRPKQALLALNYMKENLPDEKARKAAQSELKATRLEEDRSKEKARLEEDSLNAARLLAQTAEGLRTAREATDKQADLKKRISLLANEIERSEGYSEGRRYSFGGGYVEFTTDHSKAGFIEFSGDDKNKYKIAIDGNASFSVFQKESDKKEWTEQWPANKLSMVGDVITFLESSWKDIKSPEKDSDSLSEAREGSDDESLESSSEDSRIVTIASSPQKLAKDHNLVPSLTLTTVTRRKPPPPQGPPPSLLVAASLISTPEATSNKQETEKIEADAKAAYKDLRDKLEEALGSGAVIRNFKGRKEIFSVQRFDSGELELKLANGSTLKFASSSEGGDRPKLIKEGASNHLTVQAAVEMVGFLKAEIELDAVITQFTELGKNVFGAHGVSDANSPLTHSFGNVRTISITKNSGGLVTLIKHELTGNKNYTLSSLSSENEQGLEGFKQILTASTGLLSQDKEGQLAIFAENSSEEQKADAPNTAQSFFDIKNAVEDLLRKNAAQELLRENKARELLRQKEATAKLLSLNEALEKYISAKEGLIALEVEDEEFVISDPKEGVTICGFVCEGEDIYVYRDDKKVIKVEIGDNKTSLEDRVKLPDELLTSEAIDKYISGVGVLTEAAKNSLAKAKLRQAEAILAQKEEESRLADIATKYEEIKKIVEDIGAIAIGGESEVGKYLVATTGADSFEIEKHSDGSLVLSISNKGEIKINASNRSDHASRDPSETLKAVTKAQQIFTEDKRVKFEKLTADFTELTNCVVVKSRAIKTLSKDGAEVILPKELEDTTSKKIEDQQKILSAIREEFTAETSKRISDLAKDIIGKRSGLQAGWSDADKENIKVNNDLIGTQNGNFITLRGKEYFVDAEAISVVVSQGPKTLGDKASLAALDTLVEPLTTYLRKIESAQEAQKVKEAQEAQEAQEALLAAASLKKLEESKIKSRFNIVGAARKFLIKKSEKKARQELTVLLDQVISTEITGDKYDFTSKEDEGDWIKQVTKSSDGFKIESNHGGLLDINKTGLLILKRRKTELEKIIPEERGIQFTALKTQLTALWNLRGEDSSSYAFLTNVLGNSGALALEADANQKIFTLKKDGQVVVKYDLNNLQNSIITGENGDVLNPAPSLLFVKSLITNLEAEVEARLAAKQVEDEAKIAEIQQKKLQEEAKIAEIKQRKLQEEEKERVAAKQEADNYSADSEKLKALLYCLEGCKKVEVKADAAVAVEMNKANGGFLLKIFEGDNDPAEHIIKFDAVSGLFNETSAENNRQTLDVLLKSLEGLDLTRAKAIKAEVTLNSTKIVSNFTEIKKLKDHLTEADGELEKAGGNFWTKITAQNREAEFGIYVVDQKLDNLLCIEGKGEVEVAYGDFAIVATRLQEIVLTATFAKESAEQKAIQAQVEELKRQQEQLKKQEEQNKIKADKEARDAKENYSATAIGAIARGFNARKALAVLKKKFAVEAAKASSEEEIKKTLGEIVALVEPTEGLGYTTSEEGGVVAPHPRIERSAEGITLILDSSKGAEIEGNSIKLLVNNQLEPLQVDAAGMLALVNEAKAKFEEDRKAQFEKLKATCVGVGVIGDADTHRFLPRTEGVNDGPALTRAGDKITFDAEVYELPNSSSTEITEANRLIAEVAEAHKLALNAQIGKVFAEISSDAVTEQVKRSNVDSLESDEDNTTLKFKKDAVPYEVVASTNALKVTNNNANPVNLRELESVSGFITEIHKSAKALKAREEAAATVISSFARGVAARTSVKKAKDLLSQVTSNEAVMKSQIKDTLIEIAKDVIGKEGDYSIGSGSSLIKIEKKAKDLPSADYDLILTSGNQTITATFNAENKIIVDGLKATRLEAGGALVNITIDEALTAVTEAKSQFDRNKTKLFNEIAAHLTNLDKEAFGAAKGTHKIPATSGGASSAEVTLTKDGSGKVTCSLAPDPTSLTSKELEKLSKDLTSTKEALTKQRTDLSVELETAFNELKTLKDHVVDYAVSEGVFELKPRAAATSKQKLSGEFHSDKPAKVKTADGTESESYLDIYSAKQEVDNVLKAAKVTETDRNLALKELFDFVGKIHDDLSNKDSGPKWGSDNKFKVRSTHLGDKAERFVPAIFTKENEKSFECPQLRINFSLSEEGTLSAKRTWGEGKEIASSFTANQLRSLKKSMERYNTQWQDGVGGGGAEKGKGGLGLDK